MIATKADWSPRAMLAPLNQQTELEGMGMKATQMRNVQHTDHVVQQLQHVSIIIISLIYLKLCHQLNILTVYALTKVGQLSTKQNHQGNHVIILISQTAARVWTKVDCGEPSPQEHQECQQHSAQPQDVSPPAELKA